MFNLNCRRRSSTLAMMKFRPIAPKPSSQSQSQSQFCHQPAANKPRKRTSASSASSVNQKKHKTYGMRPLIPVTKTPVPRQQPVAELKTLSLLPDVSRSPSPCGSSVTSSDNSSLTELSLNNRYSPGSSSNATSPDRSVDIELLEQTYVLSTEPVVVTDTRGGMLWCNPAFLAARSGELGFPAPVYSFLLGPRMIQSVLWVFWRKLPGFHSDRLLKPQPVRATTVGRLVDLQGSDGSRETVLHNLLADLKSS